MTDAPRETTATPKNRTRLPFMVRVTGILCPPVGLVWLWFVRGLGTGRKILGTVGLGLYSIPYAALIVWLLMLGAGLEWEWRGGVGPVPTFSKTRPDYAAVEASREQHPALPEPTIAPEEAANYWIEFRGPERDGHYRQTPINTNWPSTGLPALWRQPCGGGYASFAIANGRAFTIEQRREHEVVVAYDTRTGIELWNHSYPARFEEWMGGEGPRATPTWHEGRLFSLGAEGQLICLDAASGEVLWQQNVLTDHGCSNLPYGTANSPLIVDDKLIVLSGRATTPEARTVIAFDWRTGAVIWKALIDKMAYTSPMLVELAEQRQLLVVAATRVVGLTVEDGSVLWDYPWEVRYENSIAQPVLFSSNAFVLSGGYGQGAAGVEVMRENNRFVARELWRNTLMKNKFASSVLWEGHIYGLDESILVCLDPRTGERNWKDGRYGYGQLLLASGHLVILSGDGDLALVRAAPERHEELARFRAIEGKTWNHPAISDGLLFVRNSVEMACYDLRPTDQDQRDRTNGRTFRSLQSGQ